MDGYVPITASISDPAGRERFFLPSGRRTMVDFRHAICLKNALVYISGISGAAPEPPGHICPESPKMCATKATIATCLLRRILT